MPTELFHLVPTSLLAQATGRGWVDLLMEIDPGRVILIGIFGSMFVTATAYAIASIIRAAHGTPDESEELNHKIVELETRVRLLEQKAREASEY